MNSPKINQLFILFLILLLFSCDKSNKNKLFTLLPSDRTNVTFRNQLTESDTFNVLTFEYMYNGAGVGVGDVNQDGFTDIFFAGNQVTSLLYLNKGDMSFEDITMPAKVETSLWCTGVAMVDINQDGLLDIYVSTIQPDPDKPSVPNLFFLNKGNNSEGIPVFDEIASRIGLADSSFSTQAAFLDYDNDGDLDMYLLNNAIEKFNRNQAVGQRHDGRGKSVDKLFRNDGVKEGGLPYFSDVSAESGILTEGWGLGIVINDVDMDGYADVYVANDFASNDLLYVNNRNGTFTNKISSMLKHQEHNGMGVDMADINNDGLNDIVALDMLPDDNLRQKTMFSTIGYDRFMLFRKKGYQDQYMRNVLQLNNGNETFSEIGYLAGIHATDWSWSSLLADFDNDGYRDLFVGNGYRKDVTDQDFIAYSSDLALFSRDKDRLKTIRQEVEKMKGVKKPNFLFKNNGDLTFVDKAAEWGLDQPSYSNGAAYADLDNDGDLDLVTNNINDEAFIYRNNLIHNETKHKHSYLRVKLVDGKGMQQTLGTKITVYSDGRTLYAEHQTQRGYKSTIEDVEHFGLGEVASGNVDSVKVIWVSGKVQVLKNIPVNQTITVSEGQSVSKHSDKPTVSGLLVRIHDSLNISFRHEERDFIDFHEGQFLLPHKHSQGGPGITVGDVNSDDLEDFIVGGSASYAGTIFLQQSDGTFEMDSLPAKDVEDMGMLLFDADNDNDLDLYCVSGSSEFKNDSIMYQDRFYRNEGKGKFIQDASALPLITSSGSCVVANDFDHDGDLDLFVGGRVVPMRYPETPESYLLINDGSGKFEKGTVQFEAGMGRVGMVTSALWTDVNNDGWADLAIVGEFMPITFFINNNGKSFSSLKIPNSSGWWNSINGGDFDHDGDIDYIAGNLGLNSTYQASVEEPVSVWAKDFDGNGSVDPILTRYIQGKEYPVHPRETLTGQIASLKGILLRYSKYGTMGIGDFISKDNLSDAIKLESSLFGSVYIENKGNNNFNIKVLPKEAQFSPMFGICITDVNLDGNLDVLAVGNSYAAEPLSGFYDAGIGVCLKGNGKGDFTPMHNAESGFFVDNDAKALALLTHASGKPIWITTANRDSLTMFQPRSISETNWIRTNPDDVLAELHYTSGAVERKEIYLGSGYLSQSTSKILLSEKINRVFLTNSKGEKREATNLITQVR